MKTLPREQLLKYIEYAIKMESAVYTHDRIIENYNCVARNNRPSLNQLPEPASPGLPPEIDPTTSGFGILIVTGVITGLISIPVISMGSFGTVMGIVVLGIAIAMFIVGIKPKLQLKSAEKEYDQQIEYYKRRKDDVEKENQNRRNKYDSEMKVWNNSDRKAKARLNKEKQKIVQDLAMYYKQDIIYPKYRNLAALTSIYEYLESGRCDELTGPQGAYNLYEDELRKDIIINQLNTIISDLEQIKYNQYMLYQEVKQIQTNTQRIANELYQIKGFAYEITQIAALNTYYNGINAASSSALAFSRSL